VLTLVSVVKIDTVTAIMFGLLAAAVVVYLILALLPARSRQASGLPGAAG
jgi:phage shock protein PspC (stress-responsive transcriptional regulator)